MTKPKSSGPRSGSATQGTPVSGEIQVPAEEREHMVAEAAYYRAEARGFRGGDPADDWLAAEREINRLLPSPRQQKEELAAYQRLRRELRERLASARDAIDRDALHDAWNQAAERLRAAGEYTAETAAKVTDNVRKDLVTAARRMGPKWEAFSEKTADVFDVWRDRGAAFLGSAAHAVGAWLRDAGERMEHPDYRTGDMTDAGTLLCLSCDQHIVLQTPGHVPPCPHCRGTRFRRL